MVRRARPSGSPTQAFTTKPTFMPEVYSLCNRRPAPSPHRSGILLRSHRFARSKRVNSFAPGGSPPRRTSSLGFLSRSFTGRFDNPPTTPPARCPTDSPKKKLFYPGREDLFLPRTFAGGLGTRLGRGEQCTSIEEQKNSGAGLGLVVKYAAGMKACYSVRVCVGGPGGPQIRRV